METEGKANTQQENTNSKQYCVDREMVTVTCKQFQPAGERLIEEPGKKNGIIFNTGWSMHGDGRAVAPLCQEYSNFSGVPTYALDIRGEKTSATQMHGGEAVRRFILENGFTDVTIVGDSQGGIRAANEVVSLQLYNPDIHINGLILLESMRLYEQKGPASLVKNFINDIEINMPLSVMKHPIKNREAVKQGVKIFMDGHTAIAKELTTSGTNYPSLLSEIQEMVKLNPQLKEIKAPIVMIQGAYDLLSSPRKIIPRTENQEGVENYITGLAKRQQHLKDTLFPNSLGVRMVIAKKLGHHSVPYLRYGQVARGSLITLERLKREHL